MNQRMLRSIEKFNQQVQIVAAFAEAWAGQTPDDFGFLLPEYSMFCIPGTKENLITASQVFGKEGWVIEGRDWRKSVDGVAVKLTNVGAVSNDPVPVPPRAFATPV